MNTDNRHVQSPGLQRLKMRVAYCLIDRVLDHNEKKRLVALKNITQNEYFMSKDSFCSYVPESILIDVMSQSAMLLVLEDALLADRLIRIEKIEQVEIKQDVFAGDQLRVESEIKASDDNKIKIESILLVDGSIVCESIFLLRLGSLPSRPQIHSSAVVHPSAVIGKDVVIGANTFIGQDVMIGDRTVLESNIVVEKWTKIGQDCHIHYGSVVGGAPQDKKYAGEQTWLVIGDRNLIREYVTINRGTKVSGKGETRIGNDNLILAYSHVAHDCILEDNVVITNGTALAGHVHIESNAVIGGMTAITQFVRIGQGSMVGAFSKIIKDIPPYTLFDGNPGQVHGLNIVGLRRSNCSSTALNELKKTYKILYRSDKNKKQALDAIANETFHSKEVKNFINFCKIDSKRGLAQ